MNIKNIRKSMLWLLPIIAAASCSQNNDNGGSSESSETNKVTFLVGDIATRVAGTQFELGDVINVEAYTTSGELYGKELYLYDVSAYFTSSNPFVIDGQTSLSYAALYPADATSDDFANDFTFDIETNQSTKASYEQSDMLVAKVASTSLLNPELSFYHTMSIIVVNIVGVSSMSDISAKLYAQSSVECNIENGLYQGVGSVNTISPYITTSGFETLVAPQQLSSGTIAEMTIGENQYIWESNMSSTLLSGYKYCYTWSIDETTGESTIIFNGVLNEWGNGEWTPGDITTGETETDIYNTILFNSDVFDDIVEGVNGEFEIDGITFEYAGINIFEEDGVEYFEISESGYIENTSALNNLFEVVIDVYNDNVDDLVVSGGSSVETENDYNIIITYEESPFTFKIPNNCVYIKLSAGDESGSVRIKEIEFKQKYTDEVEQ